MEPTTRRQAGFTVKYLLDTNVLVYRIDPTNPAKQQRAREVLSTLVQDGLGALSAQALAEYASVTLKRYGLPPDRISTHVTGFRRVLPVHPITPGVILEALRGVRDYGFSYYDAQIWAVAKLHQADFVVSEDFNPGATLEGVTFLNPFAPGFDVSTLI